MTSELPAARRLPWPADLRIDNRIMYTGGLGAMELGLLGEGVENIMALPLSVGGKNIFFDRTAK